MRIYVLTENNYLFYGVFFFMGSNPSINCSHLKNISGDFFISHTEGDLFIIDLDFPNFDFHFLVMLKNRNIRAFIASNGSSSEFFTSILFPVFGKKKLFNELERCSKFEVVDNYKASHLNMLTKAEVNVTTLVMKGFTINKISRILAISIKTAYSHQASAFKKIGVRKRHDLIKLPRGYIFYLCSIE